MSQPEFFSVAVDEIERDLVSGAHDLARRAAELLKEVAARWEGDNPTQLMDLMRMSAATLARTRPAVSAIANASAEVFERVERAVAEDDVDECRDAAKRVVATYLRELDRAFADTVRQTADMIGEEKAVLTLSFSRTVFDGLRAAAPRMVIVAESRPAFEGRQTAAGLADAGFAVELVSDAAAPGIVREVDLVLFGADSVLADGAVVNKVGTYPIALAAKEAGVPVFAACEALKICPHHTVPSEVHAGEELWDRPAQGVVVRNHYFELIIPDLITGVVTEQGVLGEEEASKVAAKKRRALRAIGVG